MGEHKQFAAVCHEFGRKRQQTPQLSRLAGLCKASCACRYFPAPPPPAACPNILVRSFSWSFSSSRRNPGENPSKYLLFQ